jgi:molybdate transport system ATP-binding protein
MSGSNALEARFRVSVGSGESRFSVDAELAIDTGVLVLFGPSGAGKTLTLQALAGLVTPTSGAIVIAGETLFEERRAIDVPAHRRRLGYVPQHHALFPHLDVAANVAFGRPRSERRGDGARTEALLEELGITHLAKAMPARLSGGERQRVALARALAVEPRLLLLDEPFASIDRAGRTELLEMLRAVLAKRRTSAIFVTHDPDEARAVGDRLTLYERGRTVTTGTPAELLGSEGLVVRGEAAGPPTSNGSGRSALALRNAVLEGPSDVIASADGALRFEVGKR